MAFNKGMSLGIVKFDSGKVGRDVIGLLCVSLLEGLTVDGM